MSFFSNLFNTSPSSDNITGHTFNVGNPNFFDNYRIDEFFDNCPQLQIVIDKHSRMFAGGVWSVKSSLNKKTPFLDLLNNPNFIQNGYEFLKQMKTNELKYGFSTVYKNQQTFGISSLQVLENQKMNIILRNKGLHKLQDISAIFETIEYEGLDISKGLKDYLINSEGIFNNISNFTNSDCMNSLGQSKVLLNKKPIANIIQAYECRNVLIKERGAIGILSSDSKKEGQISMTEPERLKLEKQFQKSHGIAKGQTRVHITTTPVKYQSMAMNMKDLMLFEEVADDFKTLIDNFGLHCSLFSMEKQSTFDNQQDAKIQIYEDTIIPYANGFSNSVSKWVNDGNEYVLTYPIYESLMANKVVN